MKSPMKFALSLLLGASVFTLTACDNQETNTQEIKTTEKSTALSENTQGVAENTKLTESEKSDDVSKAENESAISVKNDEAISAEAKTESEKAKMASETDKANIVKTENATVTAEPKQKRKKATKASHESTYIKEQKALLKELESQYAQVRCTPEAAKLGENSFCRQEERRLFLEIERVKGEIRLNQ
ncbi:hypothetical protein [Rodentibacter myodis]|uniref:Lipoprotein n=1 Tax=Rodentibacter myodis TaxID=1907939 RepID=A0A1V3JTL0_9PAST|nr:hypothetical protein [Rodentibacter myodis]OOF59773.1 hypothetical protein BKL49_03025 [Rodentibacter myodis]